MVHHHAHTPGRGLGFDFHPQTESGIGTAGRLARGNRRLFRNLLGQLLGFTDGQAELLRWVPAAAGHGQVKSQRPIGIGPPKAANGLQVDHALDTEGVDPQWQGAASELRWWARLGAREKQG